MPLAIMNKKTREVNRVVLLALREISGNPSQPRKHFDDASICELAESIRENGLLQPITVRRAEDGGYHLIAGERRTLAFRHLKRELIPAIVEDCSENQSATFALIENLQRENLNYFEQSLGIARLMKEQGLTQHQVSVKLGMAQSTVANKLRLLQYSPDVQRAFLEGKLTERHASALLRIEGEEQQLQTIAHIVESNLNVEQTERYVEALSAPAKEEKQGSRIFIVKDMRIFINSITKAINTMQHAGIEASSNKRETDEYLEYTIRIPKTSAFSVK
jgi:ParB family chromosome partitioning protein